MEIKEKLLAFYKEAYFFELDRKDKINSNLNLPITVLVLVVGVLSYYLNNLPNLGYNFSSVVFCLSILILIVNTCVSFYFLYRCFTGYSYDYIDPTKKIFEYVNDIRTYNKQVDKVNTMDVDYELTELFIDQYCRCATINSQNNKRKTGYLRSTSFAILSSVLTLAISAFPFFVLKYQFASEIQKIEITNLEEIIMADNKDKPEPKPQTQGNPNPATLTPKSVPPKPVKPEIVISVRESEERKQRVITEEKPKPKPKE